MCMLGPATCPLISTKNSQCGTLHMYWATTLISLHQHGQRTGEMGVVSSNIWETPHFLLLIDSPFFFTAIFPYTLPTSGRYRHWLKWKVTDWDKGMATEARGKRTKNVVGKGEGREGGMKHCFKLLLLSYNKDGDLWPLALQMVRDGESWVSNDTWRATGSLFLFKEAKFSFSNHSCAR